MLFLVKGIDCRHYPVLTHNTLTLVHTCSHSQAPSHTLHTSTLTGTLTHTPHMLTLTGTLAHTHSTLPHSHTLHTCSHSQAPSHTLHTSTHTGVHPNSTTSRSPGVHSERAPALSEQHAGSHSRQCLLQYGQLVSLPHLYSRGRHR